MGELLTAKGILKNMIKFQKEWLDSLDKNDKFDKILYHFVKNHYSLMNCDILDISLTDEGLSIQPTNGEFYNDIHKEYYTIKETVDNIKEEFNEIEYLFFLEYVIEL